MNLNDREEKLIHQYIFLSFARKVLERDIQIVLSTNLFKIKQPYIKLLEKKINEISKTLRNVKYEMQQRKIHVNEKERDQRAVTFIVRFRGYAVEHRYMNDALKTHVEKVLCEVFDC